MFVLYSTVHLFLTWLLFSFSKGLLAEMSGNKSDRSISPAATSEESRRDLLARQHRALYGNDSPAFFPPASFGDDSPRPDGQVVPPTTTAGGIRGPSPRGVDPFGLGQVPGSANQEGVAQAASAGPTAAALHSPPRASSTSSPPSTGNPVYGGFEGAGEQPITTTSSPGRADSPSSYQTSSKSVAAGPIGSVGPIGSRPVGNPTLNKRSTTPLASPLSFGFTASEATGNGPGGEQLPPVSMPSVGSAGNRASIDASGSSVGLGWGGGSGVWGSKNGLGVQASVWG